MQSLVVPSMLRLVILLQMLRLVTPMQQSSQLRASRQRAISSVSPTASAVHTAVKLVLPLRCTVRSREAALPGDQQATREQRRTRVLRAAARDRQRITPHLAASQQRIAAEVSGSKH